MKRFKKFLALTLATATIASVTAGCGSKTDTASTAPAASAATSATSSAAPAASGEIYYLNFKPEIADVYKKIGDAYKQETGVSLKVVTAAAGT